MYTVSKEAQEAFDMLTIKAYELGRKPTFEEVDADARMPRANFFTYYYGSFSDAVQKAWYAAREVMKDLARGGVLSRAIEGGGGPMKDEDKEALWEELEIFVRENGRLPVLRSTSMQCEDELPHKGITYVTALGKKNADAVLTELFERLNAGFDECGNLVIGAGSSSGVAGKKKRSRKGVDSEVISPEVQTAKTEAEPILDVTENDMAMTAFLNMAANHTTAEEETEMARDSKKAKTEDTEVATEEVEIEETQTAVEKAAEAIKAEETEAVPEEKKPKRSYNRRPKVPADDSETRPKRVRRQKAKSVKEETAIVVAEPKVVMYQKSLGRDYVGDPISGVEIAISNEANFGSFKVSYRLNKDGREVMEVAYLGDESACEIMTLSTGDGKIKIIH